MTPTYSFGSTPVAPATAIDSPANANLGVAPGTTGGQGMGIPAGATAAQPTFADMALAGLAKGISAAGKQYMEGAAQQAPQGAPYVAGGAIQRQGAVMPLAQLTRTRMPAMLVG